MHKFVISLALYVFVILGSSGAFADEQQAKVFIQEIGDKVISIVTAKGINDSKKEQQLDELFIQKVDVNWIAKFVAGRYWRESSSEQQKKYMELYSKFLLNSYVPKFRQYTDQKMVINKVSAENKDEYMVETSINDQDGKSYRVDYRIRVREGKLSIYDIIAEGVSMITTQRSDFGSILSREGMDSLISKLASKT